MTTRELFGLDQLDLSESLQEALRHGEVFTRRWVVETVLDMVGYTVDRDLADLLIVEPAGFPTFRNSDFLSAPQPSH